MNHWQDILIPVQAVLAIFLIVAVGMLIRRLNWLTEETDAGLMRIVVRVLLPCLVFHSIVGNDAMRDPSNLIYPPLVGMGTILAGFALSYLVARYFGRPLHLITREQIATFTLVVGVYNYGYVPIPLTMAMFEDYEATLGVLFIHNVGVELAFFSVGIMLLAGFGGGGWWKRLINPPAIAIVVALLFNAAGLDARMPAFVMDAVKMMGAATIPLSLLLIGATVSDQMKLAGGGLGLRMGVAAVVLRLGILPIGFLVLARYLPCSVELKRVIVLEAAMPSAVFSIVLARHYPGDPAVAIRVVLITSLVSLATIPLWLHFGLWFVGL